MYYIAPKLSKEYILKNISEEQIFEKYLGITISNNKNEFYKNTLRGDTNAGCTFNRYNNILYFRDWAKGKTYDCFNVVEEYYNCSFNTALEKIAIDFNLIEGKTNSKALAKVHIINSNKTKTIIQVKKIPWTKEGLDYWKKYEITPLTLNYFNVHQISHLWINDKLIQLRDVSFCYYFGNGYFKILQPYNENYKWISNTDKSILQGYNQLPSIGKELVISKSLKDVMLYYQLGIPAISPASESTLITMSQYIELFQRFDNIVVNYDYDYAGIINTNKLKKMYNLKYVFFPYAKDISDFVESYSLQELKQIINNFKQQFYDNCF